MSLTYFYKGQLYDGPPPEPVPPPKTWECFTAQVASCDLTACLSQVNKRGKLLAVVPSIELGRTLNRFAIGPAYVVVYEAPEWVEWEVLC